MNRARPLLLPLVLVLVPGLAPSAARARPAAAAKPPAGPGERVPATTSAALLLDGQQAGEGLRALLGAAGAVAPALQPSLAGQDLARAVGVDLLSAEAASAAGLAPEGTRALVLGERAFGLSAPVADAARAQAALDAWLSQLGPTRKTRPFPLQGPLASGGGAQERAGLVAKAPGGLRLFTASGRGAVTLVAQLLHLGRRARDVAPLAASPPAAAALERLQGPAVLWLLGTPPWRGAVLRLEAGAQGISVRGLLLPAPFAPGQRPLAALLEGASPAPAACSGAPLLCVRAAPGPLLRELCARTTRELSGRVLATAAQREAFDAALQALVANAAGGAAVRVESLDVRALGASSADDLAALDLVAASGASRPLALKPAEPAGDPGAAPTAAASASGFALPGPPPACAGSDAGQEWLAWPCKRPAPDFSPAGGPTEVAARLDTAALARALGPLNALDALRSSTAGVLFAAKLLWGDLLAASGPLEVSLRPLAATAQPSPRAPTTPLDGALELELRWPLSGKPRAQ